MLAAALLSLVVLSVWLGRPVSVHEPAADRIACLSYTPHRLPGETPLDPDALVPAARIATDLDLLKPFTGCVRTYAVDRGLDAVPALAAERGMRVLLGIWIGSEPEVNQEQIAQALAVLETHAAHIDGVVVGNEVLLRRERTVEQLAELLRQVQAATDVPVTYADVWEFWIQNRELADVVDYVTVHILPYWEDRPVAIDDGVDYVARVFLRMQQSFPGREVVIGETGWPSAGRTRGPAAPGQVAQARFVREWVDRANEDDISYNLIEAFDQPWKRELEGAMGGHWGILDRHAQPKFPWHGPVRDVVPAMYAILFAAVLMSGLAVGTAMVTQRFLSGIPGSGSAGAWRAIAAAVAGAFAGALLPWQWQYLATWNRDAVEWAVSGGFAMLGGIAALLLVPILTMTSVLPGVGHTPGRADIGRALLRLWGWLRWGFAFGLALVVLLHAIDPRYRGYPTALFLGPLAAVVIPAAVGLRVPSEAVPERLLALIALLGLPFLLWSELPGNHEALVFGLLVASASLALLWPPRPLVAESVANPSNRPTEPGSTA